MSTQPRTGRDSLPSLTSLRFFAALFVILYHLDRQVGQLTDVSLLAWYGRSGVTFFFVLSGVVLAWTYAGSMPPLRVFWWRRFCRIWPLHIVATVLSVAVYVLLGTHVSPAGVAAAIPLIHAWSWRPDIVNGGNGATWSLSDEAFFYLVFPLLLPLLLRAAQPARQAKIVLAAVTVVSVCLWWWAGASMTGMYRAWLLDYFPPVRLLQFVAGVALGVAIKRGVGPRVPLWAATTVFLAYQLGLLVWRGQVPADADPWSPFSASQLFAVPVYAMVIAAVADRDLRRRTGWLGGRWLIRLGHWSFAWYLVHEIVIRVILAAQERTSTHLPTVLTWLVVLVVSQALAGVLYTFVEHPVERGLRRRVTGSRQPVPTPG